MGTYYLCIRLYRDEVYDIPVAASALAMINVLMSMIVRLVQGRYCLICSVGRMNLYTDVKLDLAFAHAMIDSLK